jgi:3'-phosphoadenosine 5'-phosphosulfate (PAPS) 3'-phosphatase
VSSGEVCQWIDLGSGSISRRYWALDPIDGTKGFLRGDQYAIALALIEEGTVEVGALACPNIILNTHGGRKSRGGLFVAVRGQGAVQFDIDLHKRSLRKVWNQPTPITDFIASLPRNSVSPGRPS